MAYNRDARGYYSALGVPSSATPEEIKKAFKAKAQELHPDRNSAADATAKFQFLNEAFQTLNNADSRTRYDAASFPRVHRTPRIEPIVCSVCGKVSAQPRYTVYFQVMSFVLTAQRFSRGIFCSDCGAEAAYKASLFTWALGWWGIWGPFWSLHALVRNMLGGKQPPVNNFKILGWQAIYFASINRLDLARAIAGQALEFERKISRRSRLADAGIGHMWASIQPLLSVVPKHRVTLANLWGFGSRAFTIQAIGAGIVIAVVTAAVAISN